jgi:hypothetical protein
MSDQIKEQPQITPFEFLQTFPEAPSLEQIEQWKQQAPGARGSVSGTRRMGSAFMCCEPSAARNWDNCRRACPRTSRQRRCKAEVQILMAIRCCVWTSSTIDHKLSDLALKGAGAGLPQTLARDHLSAL